MVRTLAVLALLCAAEGRNRSSTTLLGTCTGPSFEHQCHGTAPFCGGNPGDCKDDWKYDHDESGGGGSTCGKKCWTGHKVVCKRCIPCVQPNKITVGWRRIKTLPAAGSWDIKEGMTWGKEHTRTETWSREVTASVEAGISVLDVFNFKRSLGASWGHTLTESDREYWQKTTEESTHIQFQSAGDLYQWAYDIDDGCAQHSVWTPAWLITKAGPPCCLPGNFVDIDHAETSPCLDGSPNLCVQEGTTTLPTTSTEATSESSETTLPTTSAGSTSMTTSSEPPTTVTETALTTVAPPTTSTSESTTSSPTSQTTTPSSTTTEITTMSSTSSTSPIATTESPPTLPPSQCRTCLTTCMPCRECVAGPDGSFLFGSCDKCWHCWDWDDDELEDDDKHMDKDCDAVHKKHDWDDDEVRCLTDKTDKDCRWCWAAFGGSVMTI